MIAASEDDYFVFACIVSSRHQAHSVKGEALTNQRRKSDFVFGVGTQI
jgi:hypothetical protein